MLISFTAEYIWKILVYHLISLNSLFGQNLIFLYSRLCSAFFKTHSKDAIKAVIHVKKRKWFHFFIPNLGPKPPERRGKDFCTPPLHTFHSLPRVTSPHQTARVTGNVVFILRVYPANTQGSIHEEKKGNGHWQITSNLSHVLDWKDFSIFLFFIFLFVCLFLVIALDFLKDFFQ